MIVSINDFDTQGLEDISTHKPEKEKEKLSNTTQKHDKIKSQPHTKPTHQHRTHSTPTQHQNKSSHLLNIQDLQLIRLPSHFKASSHSSPPQSSRQIASSPQSIKILLFDRLQYIKPHLARKPSVVYHITAQHQSTFTDSDSQTSKDINIIQTLIYHKECATYMKEQPQIDCRGSRC